MLRSAQSTLRQLSASALMAAAAVAVTHPASAQEVKIAAKDQPTSSTPYTGSAECAKDGYTVKGMVCEYKQVDKRIDAAKRDISRLKKEGEAADKRGAESDRINACLTFMINLVTTGAKDASTGETITKAYVKAKAGGPLTDANACSTAAQFGYGRRAGSPALTLN